MKMSSTIPTITKSQLSPQQQQQMLLRANERYQYRVKKLMSSHTLYVMVLFLFGVLQIIGIAFFTRGFLLSRQVLDNQSTCLLQQGSDECFNPSHFNKTVILLIDALRFDFVIPVDESNPDHHPNYHNNFPVLYDYFIEQPENSLLLKFMADPPTTTLQRLKGLTTGSLPTFIDAGSNFDGDTIDEDNLVSQFYHNDKKVAFVGDDTWTALFSPFLNPNMTIPYESLNVWDLHTVDNGVTEHLFPMLKGERGEWDVLIGHFLGVDHCGHRYGPEHHAMKSKLEQMSGVVQDVIDLLDDDTLLVVFGDHGMDPVGNHGGETQDELEAGIFMYSKKKAFGRLSSDQYDTSNLGRNYRAVNQIDLVPTLSMLNGIPIPFNNLGSPIKETFLKYDLSTLAKSSYITSSQINNYRQNSAELSSDHELNSRFTALERQWQSFGSNPTQEQLKQFIDDSYSYQSESLAKCKYLWAKFDTPSIWIGIAIIAIALILLIIYSKLLPYVVVSQLNPQMLTSSLALILVYCALFTSFLIVFKPENLPLSWALALGVAAGVANGIFAPIMDRYSIPWLFRQVAENMIQNGWTYFALLLVIMHSLVFASNSFVIWEDKIVAFWLSTFSFCAFFKALRLGDTYKKVLGAYHALVFMVLTRLISSISICREEQGDKCTNNFKMTWWTIALLYVGAIALPLIIKSFYNISHSYEGAAPFWIGKGLRSLMFLIAIMWTIEYVENDETLNNEIRLPLELFKNARLTIARVVLGIALVAANIGWSFGPMCIRLDLNNPNPDSYQSYKNEEGKILKTAHIIGYGNAYGSTYFLFVINIVCSILLVNKPLAGLSIMVLVNQILTLLELVDILNIRSNLISVVVMWLLAYLHFFTTGHQATLQAIHWEAGFLFTETIVFPITHFSILLDTFGPFIIVCVSITLLTLWKIPPTNKPITLIAKIVANVTSLLIYQLCLTLSTLIMTNHFRRHLMVWKIFAPRFMLNGLILILMNVVLTFITVGFASAKVIKRWYEVFGA